MISRHNVVVPRGLQIGFARIASLEYQEKYCVHGTVSEYVLLDELLDTMLYAIRHYLGGSTPISDSDRIALQLFLDTAEPQFDRIPWLDQNYLISQIVACDAMHEIRGAAMKCLEGMGATFSVEEL